MGRGGGGDLFEHNEIMCMVILHTHGCSSEELQPNGVRVLKTDILEEKLIYQARLNDAWCCL